MRSTALSLKGRGRLAWANRRGLTVLALSGAVLGCWHGAGAPPSPSSVTSYNVVLVCLDTVRFDTFWLPERSGQPDTFSPWGRQALRFERAQAPAPWTVPSVASVLTGLYPRRHGAGVFPEPTANLDNEIPTGLTQDAPVLAGWLQQAGFRTAAFVAHPWFTTRYGLGEGFQKLVLRSEARALLPRAMSWTEEALVEKPARPFFLYLHFMEAHEFHEASSEKVRQRAGFLAAGLREAAAASAPPSVCEDPHRLRCKRYEAYVFAVATLRGVIADLLGSLSERGLLDRTVVVVFADHGEEFKDHFAQEKARAIDPRSFYGVGHGQSLYQELLHVPLLMWHPAFAGRDVATPVSLIDVFPTILHAAGASRSDGRRRFGSDLTRLTSESAKAERPRPLFSSGIAYGPEQTSAVMWPWKLVMRVDSGEGELFNLSTDPGETHPLASDSHEGAELASMLAWYRRLEPLAPPRPLALSSDDLKKLGALGYLGGRMPGHRGDSRRPAGAAEAPGKEPPPVR